MRAIRGAATVECNSKYEILSASKRLLNEMIVKNNINNKDIVSIFFSMTPDLDGAFPAQAARQLGMTDIPLMCFAEIGVENSLEKCIRILMHFNTNKNNSDLIHVYMNKAVCLRPDLVMGEENEKNQNSD